VEDITDDAMDDRTDVVTAEFVELLPGCSAAFAPHAAHTTSADRMTASGPAMSEVCPQQEQAPEISARSIDAVEKRTESASRQGLGPAMDCDQICDQNAMIRADSPVNR
jgi:hypothetical protein